MLGHIDNDAPTACRHQIQRVPGWRAPFAAGTPLKRSGPFQFEAPPKAKALRSVDHPLRQGWIEISATTLNDENQRITILAEMLPVDVPHCAVSIRRRYDHERMFAMLD